MICAGVFLKHQKFNFEYMEKDNKVCLKSLKVKEHFTLKQHQFVQVQEIQLEALKTCVNFIKLDNETD